MSFREKLEAARAANQSLLCVGLDPRPGPFPLDGDDVLAFNRAIIDATSDLVCAYKPNAAFYEARGLDGWRALRDTLAAVPDSIPVILDAKRGDIANSAAAYAEAAFDILGADAITVSPYMGGDSVRPFLERPDRAAFVLCRTSNPGAADLQELDVGGEPLYLRVAQLAGEWGAAHGNSGLVVGASDPAALRAVRSRCPDLPILLPGVGAQGGDLEACVAAGLDAGGGGLLINASRSILYASTGSDFAQAARAEASRLRTAINDAINDARPASDRS